MKEKELYLLVPLERLTYEAIMLIGRDIGIENSFNLYQQDKYCDEVVDRYLVSIEDGQIVKEYIEVS